jgi:hypothetical protein
MKYCKGIQDVGVCQPGELNFFTEHVSQEGDENSETIRHRAKKVFSCVAIYSTATLTCRN